MNWKWLADHAELVALVLMLTVISLSAGFVFLLVHMVTVPSEVAWFGLGWIAYWLIDGVATNAHRRAR